MVVVLWKVNIYEVIFLTLVVKYYQKDLLCPSQKAFAVNKFKLIVFL